MREVLKFSKLRLSGDYKDDHYDLKLTPLEFDRFIKNNGSIDHIFYYHEPKMQYGFPEARIILPKFKREILNSKPKHGEIDIHYNNGLLLYVNFLDPNYEGILVTSRATYSSLSYETEEGQGYTLTLREDEDFSKNRVYTLESGLARKIQELFERGALPIVIDHPIEIGIRLFGSSGNS